MYKNEINFISLVNNAKLELKKASVADYKTDVMYLLKHCTNFSDTDYFLHQNDVVDEYIIKKFNDCIKRRINGEPVQYITNKAYFMGYEFYVDRNVLIPRFDTEILVDTVQKYIKSDMKVLDMCTGSGCIIISILKQAYNINATASDISASAINVAKKNAISLGVNVNFVESNLFENIKGNYDIIVSNPPYIDDEDMLSLDKIVAQHEPHIALYGGCDGLKYYRLIIKNAVNYLFNNGLLFFEVGYNQSTAVCNLMKIYGFEKINIIKDFNNIDRVVYGRIKNGHDD